MRSAAVSALAWPNYQVAAPSGPHASLVRDGARAAGTSKATALGVLVEHQRAQTLEVGRHHRGNMTRCRQKLGRAPYTAGKRANLPGVRLSKSPTDPPCHVFAHMEPSLASSSRAGHAECLSASEPRSCACRDAAQCLRSVSIAHRGFVRASHPARLRLVADEGS